MPSTMMAQIPARETAALQHRLLPDPHGRKPKLGLSRSNPSLHHIDRLEQIRQHREDLQRTVYDFTGSDFGGLSWTRSMSRRFLYKGKAPAQRFPHPSQVDLRERVEASEKLEEGLKPDCIEKLDEIQERFPRLGLYLPTVEKFATHEHKFGTGGHDTGPDLDALPQNLQQQESEMIASARSGASSSKLSPTSKTIRVINNNTFTIVNNSSSNNDPNQGSSSSTLGLGGIQLKRPDFSSTEFPAINTCLGEGGQTAPHGGFRQTAPPATGFFRGQGLGAGAGAAMVASPSPTSELGESSICFPFPGLASPAGTMSGLEGSPSTRTPLARSFALSGQGFGLRSQPRMLQGPVISRTWEAQQAESRAQRLSNSASAPELRAVTDNKPPPVVWPIPSWNKVTLKTLVQN